MKKFIHTILWKARFNRGKSDLNFEVTEENCYVKKVSHPIAKWMLDKPWVWCYGFLKERYAEITSMEVQVIPLPAKNEDLYHFHSKNPRRLSDREWLERQG